jgi:hypothetical protein
LLAQKVLRGETRGYRHHPQLRRFRETDAPLCAIARYLAAVCDEAERRGYRFARAKIGPPGECAALPVSEGQLAYEWAHLREKLARRDPELYRAWREIPLPEPHPLFYQVAGGIAEWEVVKPA